MAVTAKYNNGTAAALGDDVILVSGDLSTYQQGKVISIQGSNIRIVGYGVSVPANNAILIADAHAASTTGIVATVAPAKKK
jgi:hypothetical protein